MGLAAVKSGRSLKARALHWLAQREHSRVELKRKLLAHLARAAGADIAARSGSGSGSGAELAIAIDIDADPAAEMRARDVDALLDWLEARHYLSSRRFVESRIHVRAPRFGNLRIRQELRAHELAPPAEAAAALEGSELTRARAVHSRKFPSPAPNAADAARRARFLAGRGFSPDVVRRVVREVGTLPDEDLDGHRDENVDSDAAMKAASSAGA